MKLLDSNARPLIEVCVASVSDAVLAEAAGADRLEVCSAIELGGLTPSAGLVQRIVETVNIPVVAMVRPRAGGFCYREEEYQTAITEAKLLREMGVDGLVFGFLNTAGQVDQKRCAEFVQLSGNLDAVFHRAFDFVPDPLVACEQLIDAGVTRLLTSGQAPDAFAGAAMIRQLCEISNDRLAIMAGGRIRSHNVVQIMQQTGCRQLHVGAANHASDNSLNNNPNQVLDSPDFPRQHRVLDQEGVAAVVNSIANSGTHETFPAS